MRLLSRSGSARDWVLILFSVESVFGACTGAFAQTGIAQTEARAPSAAPGDTGGSPGTAKTDATPLTEVIVTGTRGSIERSQAVKENSIGVVDAVSAEEAGKFPDQNIADSLQRIPGVSVDRSGGESRFITVRGFGPEFNTVLMNGRTIATENAGREFSFDVLPSELISAAVVEKTSTAMVSEGGIGATVDIRTARPLDTRGFHIAGSVAAQEQSLKKQAKPKVSLLLSDTNDDHTFGVLGSFVYSEQEVRFDSLTTGGWLTNQTLGTTPVITGVAVPRTLEEDIEVDLRKRTGINGALDWRPTDSLTVKLDATYSTYAIHPVVNGFGSYTDPNDIKSAVVNGNGTVTSFTRGNTGDLANDNIVYSKGRDATNELAGLNVAYEFSERTTATWDAAYSHAKDNRGGKDDFLVLGVRNVGTNPSFTLNGPGGLPEYTNLVSTTDPANLRAHYVDREGNNVEDKILETRLDFKTRFSDGVFSELKYGVSASDRTKTSNTYRSDDSNLNCAYCGYNVTVPASIASPFNAGNILGASGRTPSQWFTYDINNYFNYLTSDAAINQLSAAQQATVRAAIAQLGGYSAHVVPQDYSQVKEKSYAAYLETNLAGQVNDMPWLLDVGVRYVRTNVVSDGISAQLTGLIPIPNDPTNAIGVYSAPEPISKGASYHDFLPSMNFKLNLRDDLIYRLAASRTVTRPTLTQLVLSQTYNTRPGAYTVSHGNPALLPYKADNVDTGLEWYFNKSSYAAASLFYKKVDNFIESVTRPITYLNFPFLETVPINANTAKIEGAEFSYQQTFDMLPGPFDGLGTQINFTYVHSQQSLNPAIVTGQFAVVGLSDSGNLVLFYEKNRIELRAALNWRDKYLSNIQGQQGQPETVKAYSQVDLSASYKLTDHLSMFGTVQNLTDATTSSYQRYPERFLTANDYGRTVMVGLRGSW